MSRTERDKAKAFQERHQAILSALLKDEDNKYCVDCDAKGENRFQLDKQMFEMEMKNK